MFISKIKVFFKFYGFLGILAVAGFILILFFWFKVNSSSQDYVQKNEELNTLMAKRINLLQFKRGDEKMQAIAAKVKNSFVTQDNIVDFIIFAENSGKDTGNLIKIKSVLENPDNQTKSLGIDFNGSYPGLVNFLARLENSPYLVKINKLDLNKIMESSGIEKKTVFKAQVDLEVLSL